MREREVKSVKYNLIGGGLPFGCKVQGGKIVPAFSIGEIVKCPDNVRFATYVHYSKKLYAMSSFFLYSAVEGGTYDLTVTADAKMPFFIEYREGTKQVSKVIFD